MQNNSDGIAFEQYVKSLFENMAIPVKDTPTSGDYGADLIVDYVGKRFAIQCKYYSGAVGVHAIQEVFSSLSYYKADYGVVITNSVFTQQAMTLAVTNHVLTIAGHSIKNLVLNADGHIELFDRFMRYAGQNRFLAEQNGKSDDEDWLISDLEIRYGVSASTIRQSFMSIGLPYYKVGRQYHFKLKELWNWELRQRYVKLNNRWIELPAFTKCRADYQQALDAAIQAVDFAKIDAIVSKAQQYQIPIDTSRIPQRRRKPHRSARGGFTKKGVLVVFSIAVLVTLCLWLSVGNGSAFVAEHLSPSTLFAP